MFKKIMRIILIFIAFCLICTLITGIKYQNGDYNDKKKESIKVNEKKTAKEKVKTKDEKVEEIKESEETSNDTVVDSETKTTNQNKTNSVNKKSNTQNTNNTNNANNNKNDVKANINNNETKTETKQEVVEQPAEVVQTQPTQSTDTSAIDQAFKKQACTYSNYKENGVDKVYTSFESCVADYNVVLSNSNVENAGCYTSNVDSNGNQLYKMDVCYK